ncbi:MAG: hypothetical protein IT233_03840 [Bacteroidia bacterium]|nr:hypothetical protein [Bacteroidia bacterium]
MKTLMSLLLAISFSLVSYAGGEGKLGSKAIRMSDQILKKLSGERYDLETGKTAATVLFRVNEKDLIEILEIQGGDKDFNAQIMERLNGKRVIPSDVSRDHVYTVRIIYSKM